ncbi:unnamed protein product [Sphenostylis stenocarpa]|uniref:Uncharacterized protein n=1 Tax=Sphenostylis stenocarpa TaxID=92480 RepID=A0AA86RSV4_9FABA|nr:unnamed protein product [Sphenostylis stenocarpa]
MAVKARNEESHEELTGLGCFLDATGTGTGTGTGTSAGEGAGAGMKDGIILLFAWKVVGKPYKIKVTVNIFERLVCNVKFQA